MHHLLSVAAVLLVATSTSAQTDDWSSFPTTPAAPPKPSASLDAGVPPRPPPQPAPAPTAAPPQPVTGPTTPPAQTPTSRASADERPTAAQQRVEERLKASPQPSDGGVSVVSKQERYLPGTEPHSPGTFGNAFDAPSNGRVTAGQVGVGTLLLSSARLGPAGVVRVSMLAEYLNQVDFPVRQAQNIRSGITFALSFQPLDWLELFVAYGATANTNNRTSPNLIQALGDFTLGAKASRQWFKGFWAGLDVRMLSFSGVGNQSVDRFAFGVRPSLLAAYDVRAAAPMVPLILNVGLGFTFDGTGSLISTQRLNASEEFALGINKYNRFNFGVSLEVPLPWVMPFVEYNLASPLGVANNLLTGPDGLMVPVGEAMPQTLGLGLKVTAVKDLTLTVGFNLGLARRVGLGVPATPPWNFLVGAGFAIDPFQRGETKIVETLQERRIEQKVAEAAKTTRVEGVVLDAATNRPLQGAVINVAGAPSAATDATGKFQTVELTDLTQAKLTVLKDGYKTAEQSVPLTMGKPSRAELALQPDVKAAAFDIFVTSAKKPIKAAVVVKGPTETSYQQETTAQGATQVQAQAGTYTVSVTADGFLSQTRDVQIAQASTMALTFDLVPVPKKALVILKGDKIEILQQVHFATGKATILTDSYSLLQQVVDVIVRNGVKRIRIEGHTDNRGNKATNLKLSEDRAASVADFLAQQGVDRSRFESVGFGDSKPVAPNLTAKGRELNRRVEFIVLEK